MHELATAEKILSIVLRHAGENGVSRVLRVSLDIGAMSGLEALWLQRYFDRLAGGTVAEGASLDVETIPVGAVCGLCGNRFDADLLSGVPVTCPACGGANCGLVSGDEYRVRHMEAI